MNNLQLLGRLFFVFCASTLAACSTISPEQFLSVTSKNCHPVHDNYRDAIVKLNDLNGSTSSGVVVAPNRVITVAHAIEPNGDIFVEIDQILHQAKVISINRSTDLAYLAVHTGNILPIAVAENPLRSGESVWAAGYPLASSQRISTGFFENMSQGRLYTSVHINSGTSGGGLLRCEEGAPKLAGIVHGYVALRRDGSVINIGDSTSVPAAEIIDFIRDAQPKRIASHPSYF